MGWASSPAISPGMVWLDTSGTSHPVLTEDKYCVPPSILPPAPGQDCPQPQDSSANQSRTGLAGLEPCCSTWGFCYLLFTARAAQDVTIINKATAREQSSLVSCTPQAGQGKHTTSPHFKRDHAHCTSARARPRAKPACAKPLSRRLHRTGPMQAKKDSANQHSPIALRCPTPSGCLHLCTVTRASGKAGTVPGPCN